MKVHLDKNLVDYMHDHHRNALTLSMMTDAHTIYTYGITKHPVINYKKPKNMELYDAYQVGDITVYVEKNVKTVNDELEFIDKKMWRFHRCQVRGIEYNYDPETIMRH